MQETKETQVRFRGGKDPLEKKMATHSSILDWETPWTESLVGYSQWGSQKSQMTTKTTMLFYTRVLDPTPFKYQGTSVLIDSKDWTRITFRCHYSTYQGFPGGSDGKESPCNAVDPDSIPLLGDSLERGMATHSTNVKSLVLIMQGCKSKEQDVFLKPIVTSKLYLSSLETRRIYKPQDMKD